VHPAYFETRFRAEDARSPWPPAFAIVTAFATTGETWTDAENARADEALGRDVARLGRGLRRVAGYSPTSGHAEPGYAVELPLEAALRLGRGYRQDAIYYVEGDALRVVRCEDGRAADVGPFRARLDGGASAE